MIIQYVDQNCTIVTLPISFQNSLALKITSLQLSFFKPHGFFFFFWWGPNPHKSNMAMKRVLRYSEKVIAWHDNWGWGWFAKNFSFWLRKATGEFWYLVYQRYIYQRYILISVCTEGLILESNLESYWNSNFLIPLAIS